MTCPSEVRRHLDDALRNDPRSVLVAVRHLSTDDLPWLEERAVRLARIDGYTWARIGRLLGRSRQAVRQRFGSIDGTPQPLPARPLTDDARIVMHWNRAKADLRRRQDFVDTAPEDVVPW